MRKFLWALALVATIIPSTAKASLPCATDADSVSRDFPSSHPSWTEHMPGHKGTKCWFPAPDKFHKKWRDDYLSKAPEVAATKATPKIVKIEKVIKEVVKEEAKAPQKQVQVAVVSVENKAAPINENWGSAPAVTPTLDLTEALEIYAAKLREAHLRNKLLEMGIKNYSRPF